MKKTAALAAAAQAYNQVVVGSGSGADVALHGKVRASG
jgi:hypothetical protein